MFWLLGAIVFLLLVIAIQLGSLLTRFRNFTIVLYKGLDGNVERLLTELQRNRMGI